MGVRGPRMGFRGPALPPPSTCPLALCAPSSTLQGTLIRLCGNTPRSRIGEIHSLCNQQSASLSCFNSKTK